MRWRLALVLLVVLAGIAAWYWRQAHSFAVAGAAYAARVGCSCRFVEGRSLDSCRKDLLPGMEAVRLGEDAKARSVTASVPLLSGQTASYREGEGCVLEKWER